MRCLKRITLKYLPSTLFLVFIGWIIYDADLGRENLFLSIGEKVPFGDKFGHFFIFGLFFFILNHAISAKRVKIGKRNIYVASIVVIMLAVTEEFTQIALEQRNFELFDILFDFLGVLFFIILYNIKELLRVTPKEALQYFFKKITTGL